MSDKDEIMQQIAPEKDVNPVENESVESAENIQKVSVENAQNGESDSVENTVQDDIEIEDESENNAENVQKNVQKTAENTQKIDKNYVKNGAKNKKKFKLGTVGKCTLVLVVIAVVAGILLGVVNWLTYVDPDSVIIEKCANQYKVSVDNVSKNEDRVYTYKDTKNLVKSCFEAKDGDGNVLGYCYYSVGAGAKDGEIELLVYIDANGIIKEIEVYEQGETAGYFDKVENANRTKYVGLDITKIDRLTLLPSGSEAQAEGEIAAVSQATYTSTGYHNAVAAAVYAFLQARG